MPSCPNPEALINYQTLNPDWKPNPPPPNKTLLTLPRSLETACHADRRFGRALPTEGLIQRLFRDQVLG